MHGPAGASYALYIAFYPQCGTTFLNDDEVADRPIRIFLGTADDYSPVGICRTYVERLRNAGRDVRLTEYPGAYHVFDWAALTTPMKLPQAPTMRRCRVVEAKEGVLLNAETRQPFTYGDPCIERGVTLAYDAAAHADAITAVTALVNTVLKVK